MQVWRGPVGAGSECGYRGCRAVGEREAPHDAEGLRGTLTSSSYVAANAIENPSSLIDSYIGNISYYYSTSLSHTHIRWCDTWFPTLKTHSLPCPQASESRLYTVSTPTKEHLRKFRLSTSRSDKPQAVICTSLAAFCHALPSPLVLSHSVTPFSPTLHNSSKPS